MGNCSDHGRSGCNLILDAFHNWNSDSTESDLRSIPVDKISHYHIDDAAMKNSPVLRLIQTV